MLTVASWNIDNLAPHLLPGGCPLAEVVARLGAPDILCLQEIRIRAGDTDLLDALASAVPGYRAAVAPSRDPRNAGFRGGRAYGVASLVRADLGGDIRVPDWDREGRLLVLELPALGLAVLNVYAVNGTAKPHWDHEQGGYRQDRHAYKLRFHQRIIEEGSSLRARGLDLVAIGDWNVSRSAIDVVPRLRTAPPHVRARAHLNDVLLPALDVVDVFRLLHPDARAYTWWSRLGTSQAPDAARVDYALVSRSLLPRVVSATIEPDPDRRFGSDHAPLAVVLREP